MKLQETNRKAHLVEAEGGGHSLTAGNSGMDEWVCQGRGGGGGIQLPYGSPYEPWTKFVIYPSIGPPQPYIVPYRSPNPYRSHCCSSFRARDEKLLRGSKSMNKTLGE